MDYTIVKEFNISKNESKLIKDIFNISVYPHLNEEDDFTNSDLKEIKRLLNDNKILDYHLESSLIVLDKVINIINNKKNVFEKLILEAPENGNDDDLIKRPKNFCEVKIENYELQINHINEIKDMFKFANVKNLEQELILQ